MRQFDFIKKYLLYIRNNHNQRSGNIWVFGEWFGKRANDNATFLANHIAEKYDSILVYCLCDESCDSTPLSPKIKVLDYHTKYAKQISKLSMVAVMGEGIIDLNECNYNYWGNAIKVNLWHGMMWKKIVNDMRGNDSTSLIDIIRNKTYRYDLFESPSEEYSAHIKTGFSTSDEHIFKAGFPRNTLFHYKDAIIQAQNKVFKKLGFRLDIHIISYLPTFRDAHTKPFSFTDIKDKSFFTWLEENNIYIIQKAHAAETSSFSSGSKHIINLTDISAQELMAASEMLITDYSSCFFDYLLLDRPIIHYLYDYDYYKNKDRGLYYDKEDVVCGPAPETEEELIKAIKENYENPNLYHNLRMERKEKFMTYESPDSCEIVTQRIFEELKKRGMILP